MPTVTVNDWVDSLQARGTYTFLRAEAISGSGLSAEAVKKALQRLARRQRVVKVKNYFYVIVPLEYLHAGAPPPSWFIDALMNAMDRLYYVGLLSAAGIHRASHQQPQEFQVLTDRPIRLLHVGRARIRFFVNKRSADTAVQSVKTPTGMMRVSTPESTAVDLVRFARAAGQWTQEVDHMGLYCRIGRACLAREYVCTAGWRATRIPLPFAARSSSGWPRAWRASADHFIVPGYDTLHRESPGFWRTDPYASTGVALGRIALDWQCR